jgi:hypothetical protein
MGFTMSSPTVMSSEMGLVEGWAFGSSLSVSECVAAESEFRAPGGRTLASAAAGG